MTTLKEQLEEIKKRVEGATEGPWEIMKGNPIIFTEVVKHHNNGSIEYRGIMISRIDIDWDRNDATDEVIEQDVRNHDFMAHSRTDIPKLLRAVEVMLKTLQNLKAAHPASDLTWIMANDGLDEVKEIFEVKK